MYGAVLQMYGVSLQMYGAATAECMTFGSCRRGDTRNLRAIRAIPHVLEVVFDISERAFCGLDDSTYREDFPVPTRTSTPLLTNTVRS